MLYLSEAEKLFKDEVREKKKTANGVHSKKGKNGYVGKMLFPSDFLSRGEKIRYRRSTKPVISNLYEKIIPVKEFEKLTNDEKYFRMKYWRDNYPNKVIMREMGVYNKQYYDIVKELNLPKAPRIYANSNVAMESEPIREEINQPLKEDFESKQLEFETEKETETIQKEHEIQKHEEPKEEKAQEIIVDGLHLIYNGTFSSEKIRNQLIKFGALLEDDENDFYCEIKLVQKIKN